jgi:hypothetical protein
VSPSAPRETDGTYWGYTTRMAQSIKNVLDECPYPGGYDLKIGTSERGTRSVEEKNLTLPKFRHSLVVFGGVAGIEECVDADETIKLPGSQSKKLFDVWSVSPCACVRAWMRRFVSFHWGCDNLCPKQFLDPTVLSPFWSKEFHDSMTLTVC